MSYCLLKGNIILPNSRVLYSYLFCLFVVIYWY
nr:MAG TPA: Gamma-aminobutyric acid receptor subunit alpha-1, PTX, Membrane, Channel, Nanobody [Caudoviricetes sp.]